MEAMKNDDRISIRVPEEEYTLLKELTKAKGTTINSIIKEHVLSYIHKNFDTCQWEEHFRNDYYKKQKESGIVE